MEYASNSFETAASQGSVHCYKYALVWLILYIHVSARNIVISSLLLYTVNLEIFVVKIFS